MYPCLRETRTELEQDDAAGGVHRRVRGHHRVQLLGGRVGARARVDEVDAPSLLDGEREHEVLDPDVRHVSRARDVQVLQRRAVLPWEECLTILTSIKAMFRLNSVRNTNFGLDNKKSFLMHSIIVFGVTDHICIK